jgi:A/G-specific adenine glycosylase
MTSRFRNLAARLQAWHEKNYRPYSFRNGKDPYKVLIAEILLRQTTARQVNSVYPRFVRMYPNVHALANANSNELRALIRPLGLRSRASNLLELAKIIEESCDGKIPNYLERLIPLPGVGEYVANSVLVRAHGQRRPLVDSNVRRVLGRVFSGLRKIESNSAEADFMKLARYVRPERLNYAIIDLAHSVCTYSKPRCRICPIRKQCQYASDPTVNPD